MQDQRIATILNLYHEELKNYSEDEEYLLYLVEKIEKAKDIAKYNQMSEEDFIKAIKEELPRFLGEYQRMQSNVNVIASSYNTNFGISISFQLIDLFKIVDECTNDESFQERKRLYFEELSKDQRFQPIEDKIFYGLKDITYEELLNIRQNVLSNVDCITPEWMGKMRGVIRQNQPLFINGVVNESVIDFTYLDKIAEFARNNNMKMRMHNIIWHKDFLPSFEGLSKEQLLEFLSVYMDRLYSRYGDVIYTVDILNEIVADEPDKVLRDSKWKEVLGDRYYIDILKIAKANFKEIPLVYNEYGEENAHKRKNIIKVINDIKEYEEETGKTILDGIGVQAHYTIGTQDNDIKEAFRDYYETGKEIQITEFDVAYRDENPTQTNRVYRTILDCAAAYNIGLVNLWGVSSRISWKSNQVSNFLDKDGNIIPECKKILNAYSLKLKGMSIESEYERVI